MDSASPNVLLIRADANSIMGTGHVMRCLALALAWQQAGGHVIWVSSILPKSVQSQFHEVGIIHYTLSSIHPNPFDIERTLAVAAQHAVDYVALDGYHFDYEYHKRIRNARIRLLVIDDYAHLEAYEADFLLNQNITAHQFNYVLNKDALKLLGTQYCLLRPEFKQRGQRTVPKKAEHILLTMGGSDPDNFTSKILDAIPKSLHQGLRIIIGAANLNFSPLKETATEYEMLFNVKDMPVIMQWADLAITSGGTTSMELSFIGVPALIISIADNQTAIASRLGRLGIMQNVGHAVDFDDKQLTAQLDALVNDQTQRATMIQMQQAMIDNAGAQRVVQALLDRVHKVSVRQVTATDAFLLWEWANDPVTRANSFRSEANCMGRSS